MAEKLAFHQPGWNSATVHLDQRAGPTSASAVNLPFNEFFPASRLARDQYVRIRRSRRFNSVEQFEEFRTIPKYLVEIMLPANLISQVDILYREPCLWGFDFLVGGPAISVAPRVSNRTKCLRNRFRA